MTDAWPKQSNDPIEHLQEARRQMDRWRRPVLYLNTPWCSHVHTTWAGVERCLKIAKEKARAGE